MDEICNNNSNSKTNKKKTHMELNTSWLLYKKKNFSKKEVSVNIILGERFSHNAGRKH